MNDTQRSEQMQKLERELEEKYRAEVEPLRDPIAEAGAEFFAMLDDA